MRFRWIAAGLIAVLALAAGCLAYFCVRAPMVAVDAAGQDDALLWLRQEFHIPADRMTRIEALHAAYQGICDEHCRQIREARVALAQLRASHAPAQELAAAEAGALRLDAVCTTSLENHMREVAAIIGGAEGERYLGIVLPRIASFDHSGAPHVDLDPSSAADPHAGHHAHP